MDFINWFYIDDDIVENPIDITSEVDKKGALCIFDDYSNIHDKKIKLAIINLINDVLELGRQYKIYCLITSHLINGNDKKMTRTIFDESHNITIYPRAGNIYGIKYMLKNYLGFSKETIDKIINLNSRWVTISKTYPNYILFEKVFIFLNNLNALFDLKNI